MSDEQLPRRTTHLTPAEKSTLTKQVAAGAAVGESTLSMAQRLNINRATVNRILNAADTQDLIKKIGDDAVRGAKSLFRAKAEELAPQVLDRLKELIRSDNGRDAAEGIKIYLRSINMEGKDDNAGSGTLIVQLPGGGKEEKAIEVQGYEVEDPDKSGAI